MYVATMTYYFKKELFNEACKKWYDIVLSKLVEKEGFVGGMLMTKPDGKAVAIGFWDDKSFADKVMQSGIMSDLMKDLGEYMTRDPAHEDYEVAYYQLR
jgi:hypothetical protein